MFNLGIKLAKKVSSELSHLTNQSWSASPIASKLFAVHHLNTRQTSLN